MNIANITITGYDDMVRSMYMSNKKYNEEIEQQITNGEFARKIFTDPNISSIFKDSSCVKYINQYTEDYEWYRKRIESAIKLACGSLYAKTKEDGSILPEQIQQCHSTIGRFLDICCVVDGLHRGATDDFDAHAKRLDSRIIRMSTRTNSPDKLELSDWYKGKILTMNELDDDDVYFVLPDEIEKSGVVYKRTKYCYVREDLVKDCDVLRGGTPLGISNLFIFKCNITEWAHIVKLRKPGTHAAPELQEMIQMINDEIVKIEPLLNDDFWRYCIQ